MITHDPLRAALEIREQLASEKRRLSFFLGAGTSMSVGMPGINELTKRVSDLLKEPQKKQFENVKKQLAETSNVENVLDRIRTIRELIGDSEESEYNGLKGVTVVKQLDSAICRAIYEIVRGDPPKGLKPHLVFSHWLRSFHINRYCPVEIFTTNYDLMLEKAMEQSGVPFFDGFVGSVTPFFAPESVEAEEGKVNQSVYPPRAWTRLWKIHGSINWLICSIDGKSRITRLSDPELKTGDELMIFPSREKYTESRKLPFITFQDRLRKFLSGGESLLIIAGYSFSDEHINEMIFQGLRSNPRLSIITLIFGDKDAKSDNSDESSLLLSDRICHYAEEHRNLTVFGSDKACIGGITAHWESSRKRKDDEVWPFWDEDSKLFTLGNFNSFASYLELFIGVRTNLNIPHQIVSPSTENEVSSKET